MDPVTVTADAETFTCNAYLVTSEPTTLVDAGAMPGVADVVAAHTINDGDDVAVGDESFEVVYTPGHAADHVSLVSETTLFSGDVVVYNDGAFDDGSFGRTDMAGQSRERLIESIELLLDRMHNSVEAMYAGHGDPFHGDVRAVVERALERAERREPKYPEK